MRHLVLYRFISDLNSKWLVKWRFQAGGLIIVGWRTKTSAVTAASPKAFAAKQVYVPASERDDLLISS